MIVLLALIPIFVGLMFKDRLNPLTTFGFMWFLVGIFHILYSPRYYDIGDRSIYNMAAFIFPFTFQCAVFGLIKFKPKDARKIGSEIGRKRLHFLFVVTLLTTPLVLLRYWNIAHMGPTQNLLMNLRYQTSVVGIDLGVLQYVLPLSIVVFAMSLSLNKSEKNKPKVGYILPMVCAFVMHAALLARAQMLSVAIVYLIIVFCYKKLNFSKYLWMALIPIVTFALITNSLGRQSESIMLTIADYFTPPIVAFDRLDLIGAEPEKIAGSIFYSASKILSLFGFQIDSYHLILPFTSTPISTNLYTVMMPYYILGGSLGVAMAGAVFGSIHGFLWSISRQGHPFWVSIYAISYIALTGQFGGDAYLSLLSYWIQITSWLVLLTLPLGIKLPRKKASISYQ